VTASRAVFAVAEGFPKDALRRCVKLWPYWTRAPEMHEAEWIPEAVNALENRAMNVFSGCPRQAPP